VQPGDRVLHQELHPEDSRKGRVPTTPSATVDFRKHLAPLPAPRRNEDSRVHRILFVFDGRSPQTIPAATTSIRPGTGHDRS